MLQRRSAPASHLPAHPRGTLKFTASSLLPAMLSTMASDQQATAEQHGEHAAHLAHTDAAQREAYEYWGYLFKKDKCGMPLLDRLLKGIAEVIVSRGRTRVTTA